MDRKMEVFSRRLRDVRREIRKEMEDLKDEIMFREEDWKKERNELKERIEKLETRRVEYNEKGQNNTRQLEQENNTRNSSSLITSTSSTFRSQSARPASGNYEGISRCNSDDIANNWSAGTSGTPARNAQSQNSNVAKPNGSNRPNVASTVSDTRENNSFRIKSDDANRSANKSNQSAYENSHNVNNTAINTDDGSAKIMCHCRKPAIQLVKKDELCKERRYYKCANSNKPQGSRCDFVLWASDSANQSQSNATDEYSSSTSKDINKLVKKLNQSAPENSHNVNNTTNTDDDSAKIMCHCQKPAIQLVKKDEQCKELRVVYYKCANYSNKLQGSRCDFVLWAFDSANQSQSKVTDEYSSSTSKDINKLVKKLNQSAPGNSRNANNTTNTDDDSAKIIMCHCRKPASKLVKKDGSYKGRLYYKCANNTKLGSRCNFFLSASDSTESRGNAANDYSSSVFNMDKSSNGAGTSNNNLGNLFTSNVMCNCNRPALKLKAQAGPDKRSCYVCPNSICRFVKWENVNSRENTNRSNYNSGAFKKPKFTESKRKCGICGREGHTRIKCPATSMYFRQGKSYSHFT